jgi:hypothetical protein
LEDACAKEGAMEGNCWASQDPSWVVELLQKKLLAEYYPTCILQSLSARRQALGLFHLEASPIFFRVVLLVYFCRFILTQFFGLSSYVPIVDVHTIGFCVPVFLLWEFPIGCLPHYSAHDRRAHVQTHDVEISFPVLSLHPLSGTFSAQISEPYFSTGTAITS